MINKVINIRFFLLNYNNEWFFLVRRIIKCGLKRVLINKKRLWKSLVLVGKVQKKGRRKIWLVVKFLSSIINYWIRIKEGKEF